MMNQFIVIGRLTKEVETREENGEKKSFLSVAVARSFKNNEGIYETDFFTCETSGNIGENVSNWCQKGDILGIKGRLQTKKDENNNYIPVLVAEKVTFLSSRKEESEEV